MPPAMTPATCHLSSLVTLGAGCAALSRSCCRRVARASLPHSSNPNCSTAEGRCTPRTQRSGCCKPASRTTTRRGTCTCMARSGEAGCWSAEVRLARGRRGGALAMDGGRLEGRQAAFHRCGSQAVFRVVALRRAGCDYGCLFVVLCAVQQHGGRRGRGGVGQRPPVCESRQLSLS